MAPSATSGLGGDDGDRVFVARIDRVPERIDFLLGDAVCGQFVGVEDAARAVALGVVGEFRAEATVGLNLPADEAVETEQRDGGDFPAAVERALDDAALGSLEHVRHVLHLADVRVARLEFVADVEEFDLPTDLEPNEVVDVVQALDALHLHACAVRDGDVHVLSDGPEAAFDVAGRTEEHPDAFGGLAGLFRRTDVRAGADFDQRDAETVEAEGDAVLALLDALGALLFEHQVLDADRTVASLNFPAGCNERGALEPRRVRPVHDDFPHDVGLVHDGHVEELCDFEDDLFGLGVESVRRFVVGLHETGGVVGEILELAVDLALFERRVVDFAEFASRRMEIAGERSGRLLGVAQFGRTATEQLLLGVELLVYLQPRHETEVLVVVLTHWSDMGGGGVKNRPVRASLPPGRGVRRSVSPTGFANV